MIKTLVFLVCGLLALSAAQNPQICTSASLEYTVLLKNSQVLTYTSNIHTKKIDGSQKTQFFVTNETFSSANMSIYYPITNGMLASVGYDSSTRCYSIGGYCSWLVGNDTVQLSLSLNIGNTKARPSMLRNIIDENGISMTTGEFFTKENNCQEIETNGYPLDGYVRRTRQCCQSFQPVPPPVAEYPKCVKFNSSITFYNNSMIFAGVQSYFDVANDAVNISTYATGPTQGSYGVNGNGDYGNCGGRFIDNDTCTVPLPKSDFKFLFQVIARQFIGANWQYSANIGRLISRNGVFEKEEGIRFTQYSPCLEQYKLLQNNTIYIFSNFCCTEFAPS